MRLFSKLLALAFALSISSAIAQSFGPPGGSSGGAPTGAAGGKLSGTYPNPGLNAACADLTNGGTACSQSYTATTWTPVLGTSGTSGTPTYVIQVGSYEQIGRQVTARFTVSISAWAGLPTGNVIISGLPVASASTSNDFGACFIGQFTAATLTGTNLSGYITPGTSAFVLQQGSVTGSGFVSPTQAGTGLQIIGSCVYHT